MRFMTITALFLLGAFAQAETINCVFTEPFFATSYNTVTKKLVLTEMDEKVPTYNIKAQYDKVTATHTEVKNQKEGLLLALYKDNQGSDGMSDRVYPISGVFVLYDIEKADSHLKGPHYGGCETTK